LRRRKKYRINQRFFSQGPIPEARKKITDLYETRCITKVSWLEGDSFIGLPGISPVAVYDEIFPVTVTG